MSYLTKSGPRSFEQIFVQVLEQIDGAGKFDVGVPIPGSEDVTVVLHDEAVAAHGTLATCRRAGQAV